jgi:hypothetical protein
MSDSTASIDKKRSFAAELIRISQLTTSMQRAEL